MVCKAGKGTYSNCPKDTFFDAEKNKCISGHDFLVSEFCIGRANGNYRNPWNCHRYLACNTEHTWNMPCQDPTFVYNSYLGPHGQCVTAGKYPCVTISSEGICINLIKFYFPTICAIFLSVIIPVIQSVFNFKKGIRF